MNNLVCKIFGHKYPEKYKSQTSLLNDYLDNKCERCNHLYWDKKDGLDFWNGAKSFFETNRCAISDEYYERLKEKFPELTP